MKRTKILVSMTVAALTVLGTSITAFADAGAYAVKDTSTNVIKQYDLSSLTEAFLMNKLGEEADLLLKEFREEQSKNGLYAIYDDSRKYISYEDAKKALEETKAQGKEFQINSFLKAANAGQAPNYVYERKISGDQLVNGLTITKEGYTLDLSKETLQVFENVKVIAPEVTITNGTLSGSLVVDAGAGSNVIVKNVVTEAITGLSGSLVLQNVEAKELTIEKALTLNVDTASTVSKLVITAPAGTEVVLSGNLGVVEVTSAVKLTIAEGTTVDIKVVTEEAEDMTVVAEEGAVVTTDKPLENVEGEGTVTTTPETTPTPTPTPTVSHTALYTVINSIFTGIDSLDNKFNSNAGYITVNAASNSATITLPSGKTAGTIVNEIKASTTVAAVSSLSEYTALVNAIKTDAAINTADIITAFSSKMNSIGLGELYNAGLPFIQNLVNLANNGNKSIIVDNIDKFVIPQGITIKGYTVTSIKENTTNTVIYNSTNKEITKANIKKALGDKTYEVAAATDIKTLLAGKNVTITLQDGSGNTTTYTISFN